MRILGCQKSLGQKISLIFISGRVLSFKQYNNSSSFKQERDELKAVGLLEGPGRSIETSVGYPRSRSNT